MNFDVIIRNVMGDQAHLQDEQRFIFDLYDEVGNQVSFYLFHNTAQRIVTLCGQLKHSIAVHELSRDTLLELMHAAIEPMRSGCGVGVLPGHAQLSLYQVIAEDLFDERWLEAAPPLMLQQLQAYEQYFLSQY